jgi:NAD(P)-dependent dehydrogenase (short-subunit alcohol dehydrogenase family)
LIVACPPFFIRKSVPSFEKRWLVSDPGIKIAAPPLTMRSSVSCPVPDLCLHASKAKENSAMPLFDGKVSIVTGGGSGIGRATALAFAKEGAKVVIADNNVDGGQETAKLLHNGFGRALFVETDVSLDSSVAALVSQTIDTFGRLDCAANIAGVTQPSIPLAETPEELFDRVMAINAKSMFLCMRHEIVAMLPAGTGAIVNMASTLALVGTAGMALYSASKHAVVGLTRSAALDYARAGIRINAVGAGATETPLVAETTPAKMEEFRAAHPIGRIARADEIAASVIWLCSDLASNVTGTILMNDGGFTAG